MHNNEGDYNSYRINKRYFKRSCLLPLPLFKPLIGEIPSLYVLLCITFLHYIAINDPAFFLTCYVSHTHIYIYIHKHFKNRSSSKQHTI
jgi:hypothetical protein